MAAATPPERPDISADEIVLRTAVSELEQAGEEYAHNFFGHFLNDEQIEGARTAIGQMETASLQLYSVWQEVRAALPSSAEISHVVGSPMFTPVLGWPTRFLSAARRTLLGPGKFTQLVQLNEQVRRTAEEIADALPVMRAHTLYARHYERNCLRLYEDDASETERLRDAENVRIALEENVGALTGDVGARRAQAESLTLYAQMLVAVHVRVLTWLLLVLTAAGVAAAFIYR